MSEKRVYTFGNGVADFSGKFVEDLFGQHGVSFIFEGLGWAHCISAGIGRQAVKGYLKNFR